MTADRRAAAVKVPRYPVVLEVRNFTLRQPPPEPVMEHYAPHVAWISFDPQGRIYAWPKSRLRVWWRKRRGWRFYDGEGRPA